MVNEKISRIILKHGLKNDFPNLEHYELGYAYDTNELFIGDPEGNIPVITSKQFDAEVSRIDNFIKDLEYFRDKENHLIYDQQIGAMNMISNGKFILPIENGKLGLTLIGDEFYPETKIFVDNNVDQGIGFKNCLSVINNAVHTAGVSFKFIDTHNSISSINNEFIIKFSYRYENIVPGTNIDSNILSLGKISLLLDYSDGTNETKIIEGINVKTGSSSWDEYSVKFRVDGSKTIDRVYGSISFTMNDCIGDFSIGNLQCTNGNVPIHLGFSDDDIMYMIDAVNDAINNLHKANDTQHDEMSNHIIENSNSIKEVSKNVSILESKIKEVEACPENKLRNTGEFSCGLYWKSTNIEEFNYFPNHRYMRLTKIAGSGNCIQVQTSESLLSNSDFTITIIFQDKRKANKDKLDVRLMSGYDVPLLPVERYSITQFDDIHSIYTGYIERNDAYRYESIEFLGIYDTFINSSEVIDILNLKLSLYPKESRWTPNPKDTVSSIRDYELDLVNMEKLVNELNRINTVNNSLLKELDTKIGSTGLFNGKVTNRNLYNFEYGEEIKDKSIEYLLNTLFFKKNHPEILSVKMYKFEKLTEEIDNYYVIGSNVLIGKIVVEYENYHMPVNNIKIALTDGSLYHCVINENIHSGIYYFDNGLKLSKTTNFTILLETSEGVSTSLNYTIPFNPPISYGSTLLNLEEIGAAEIMGQGMFVGNITKNKEVTIPFKHDGKKAFIAIPNMLVDEIVYIKDSNGINYLNSFDTLNIRINAVGIVYDYTLYLMRHKTWMHDNITIGLKGGSVGWQ